MTMDERNPDCLHTVWRYVSDAFHHAPVTAPPGAPMCCADCGAPRPLDIPAWLASLLLEQERDKRDRERRVQPEIPTPTTQEEEE